MKKDESIKVLFVELGEIASGDKSTININTELLDKIKDKDIYRIEIVVDKPYMPKVKAVESYLVYYLQTAIHSVLAEADDMQNAIKTFPEFLGGRWNWAYIGKDKKLARKLNIKELDGQTTD